MARVTSEQLPLYIAQRVACLRAKGKNSQDYIYYIIKSAPFQKYIKKQTTGTSIQHVSLKQIGDFNADFMEPEEQHKVASVLRNIDNKIALNRAIIKNLEALAKQIYDYWFVQFDFPNEEGKPYKSSGGAMVWNEKLKREIPLDWKVGKIGEFLRIFTGKKDVSKAIPGNYKFFSCAPEPITSNEYIYDGAAVLVSGNGSYTGRVSYYKGKFDLYQRTYACVPIKDGDSIPFFYYTLRYLFQPAFTGGKHGSSIPYIVLGDLADFRFAYSERSIDQFVKLISHMFDLQFNNKEEVEQLYMQRDELLPLLMNGQVTID